MQAAQCVESSSSGERPFGTPVRTGAAVSKQSIREAIESHGADVGALDRTLAELSLELGPCVWATALKLLCRLELSAADARRHWKAVLTHTGTLSRALGRPVDFRIALADYFLSVEPHLKRPVLVDQHTLESAEAGSYTDHLTGLLNFRYLERALPRELLQARRIGYPLAAVFIDIDDFKAYNDRFGHAAGNQVLVALAETLCGAVRDSDLACRFGGEELVLVLPGSDRFGALTVARRVIERVAALGIQAPAPASVVTVSAGVAAFPADGQDAATLLKAADAAMYRAKALGKNRVELYSTERRAGRRVPAGFTASVRTRDDTSLEVRGRDISEGGLGLLADSSLPVGSMVDLTFGLPEPALGEVTCRARVVRCDPRPDAAFGVGVAFSQLAEEDRRRICTVVVPAS